LSSEETSMSVDETQTVHQRLTATRSSLDGLADAIAAVRSSTADEFRDRALAYDTSYGTFDDCIRYLHFAEAYGQAAQAMLDSGNLDSAEHLLGVAMAYAGSAGDCLDQVSA
jgi:hypothetical protein